LKTALTYFILMNLLTVSQEQISIFRNILQALDATTDSSMQDPLSRAEGIINELQYVITAKLIRQGGDSDFTRRGAWLRNKAKIASLRDDLKETREVLGLALSLNWF
jgi:hypothetical protein